MSTKLQSTMSMCVIEGFQKSKSTLATYWKIYKMSCSIKIQDIQFVLLIVMILYGH